MAKVTVRVEGYDSRNVQVINETLTAGVDRWRLDLHQPVTLVVTEVEMDPTPLNQVSDHDLIDELTRRLVLR